jgi:peptidoglycan/LPS O-acetylase OafA/YrhL
MFSGIEILFFMLGFLTCFFMFGFLYLQKNKKLNWKVGSTTGIGAFLMLFTLAWSVSSVLEGEPRAASMGMVIFGIPSLLLITVGLRLAFKDSLKK